MQVFSNFFLQLHCACAALCCIVLHCVALHVSQLRLHCAALFKRNFKPASACSTALQVVISVHIAKP